MNTIDLARLRAKFQGVPITEKETHSLVRDEEKGYTLESYHAQINLIETRFKAGQISLKEYKSLVQSARDYRDRTVFKIRNNAKRRFEDKPAKLKAKGWEVRTFDSHSVSKLWIETPNPKKGIHGTNPKREYGTFLNSRKFAIKRPQIGLYDILEYIPSRMYYSPYKGLYTANWKPIEGLAKYQVVKGYKNEYASNAKHANINTYFKGFVRIQTPVTMAERTAYLLLDSLGIGFRDGEICHVRPMDGVTIQEILDWYLDQYKGFKVRQQTDFIGFYYFCKEFPYKNREGLDTFKETMTKKGLAGVLRLSSIERLIKFWALFNDQCPNKVVWKEFPHKKQ